jgi:hypothetical protein
MKITVVGAALMVGAVILAVVVVRALADRQQPTPAVS